MVRPIDIAFAILKDDVPQWTEDDDHWDEGDTPNISIRPQTLSGPSEPLPMCQKCGQPTAMWEVFGMSPRDPERMQTWCNYCLHQPGPPTIDSLGQQRPKEGVPSLADLVHGGTVDPPPPRPIQCPHCNFRVNTQEELERHIQNRHSD